MRAVPTGPGLYRVRVAGQDRLAYIGQTGRNLRERLGALIDTRSPTRCPSTTRTQPPEALVVPPFGRHELELSAAVVVASEPVRLGSNAFALAYRTEFGASTLCNFGRLAPGYRTSRNRKTGIQGGLIPEGLPVVFDRSLPPRSFRGQPDSSDWMGLDWSQPEPYVGSGSPHHFRDQAFIGSCERTGRSSISVRRITSATGSEPLPDAPGRDSRRILGRSNERRYEPSTEARTGERSDRRVLRDVALGAHVPVREGTGELPGRASGPGTRDEPLIPHHLRRQSIP